MCRICRILKSGLCREPPGTFSLVIHMLTHSLIDSVFRATFIQLKKNDSFSTHFSHKALKNQAGNRVEFSSLLASFQRVGKCCAGHGRRHAIKEKFTQLVDLVCYTTN